MQPHLTLTVVAILLISGPGHADSAPTVQDAHSYLRDIFNTGAVRIDKGNLDITGYSAIGRCDSEINYIGSKGSYGVLKFDWSHVTQVYSYGRDIFYSGAIPFEIGSREGVLQEEILYSPDHVTANRIANASQLLINACGGRSKFDG